MTEAPVPAALVFSESLLLLLWSTVPSMRRAKQNERKPRTSPGLTGSRRWHHLFFVGTKELTEKYK